MWYQIDKHIVVVQLGYIYFLCGTTNFFNFIAKMQLYTNLFNLKFDTTTYY